MTLRRMMMLGTAVQLARAGLNRRRRTILKRQRRNRGLGLLALAVGGAAAWYAVSSGLFGERTPEWPSRKKQRKEARRAQAESERRAADLSTGRPAEVHVEREAERDLKVPIGDLTR